MSLIFAIDPGAKESGWVVYEDKGIDWKIWSKGIDDNHMVAALLDDWGKEKTIAIEVIRGYGIVSGDDTFDTCIWIGRFDPDETAMLIPRKEIKRALCGNTTTNDKYVRQALIDRFGPVGSKSKPGPLWGITGHCWAALACAVTAADRLRGDK
jgi:hypothetical protein